MDQIVMQIRKKARSYYLWAGVFFVGLFLLIFALYIATKKVDYIWRWHRVSSRIIATKTFDIQADIDGKVESIMDKGKKSVITLMGSDGIKTYTIPAKSILIEKGDEISIGDTLAKYKKKQPGLLLEGLWYTFEISFMASILGIIIGLLSGLASLSENPALKWSSTVYIEIIRGSPLLVQILIWYFVIGDLISDLMVRMGLPTVTSVGWSVIALGCFAGAYVSEIVRAGIESIHRGQTEAARSLGMSYIQCMAYIILPQALRRILPPLTGQFISLIKDSSLLGMIAVRELTKATREAVTTSLQPFEFFLLLGVLYLVITFPLSMIVRRMEGKVKV